MEGQTCEPRTQALQCARRATAAVPRADIVEHGDKVAVLLDLPGAVNEGLDITVERNVLTVRADVKERSGMTLLAREYGGGEFMRKFRLSDDLDPESITASLKDGVLRIEISKSKKLTPKRITING